MLKAPTLTKSLFILRRIGRRLWVRTTLIAALALVSVSIGPALDNYVPDWLAERLAADAVSSILEILASSMLAVTTFSLSVMVIARQWASNQSTPRAHLVVREDPITQNALATFLGAFIFALVSLILVETGVYGGGSVAVILGFTLAVILLVVIAILRWIDHLSDLGGVSETAGKIEDEAQKALKNHAEQPCLGARPCMPEDIPQSGPSVESATTGYVQHVDVGIVNACAEEAGTHVWIAALPGSFVSEGAVLVRAGRSVPADRIRSAFVIGDGRNFDEDPRFGLLVLSEIAQRGLSPGVNDPGTAVSVISRLLRLLVPVRTNGASEEADTPFPHVFAPRIAARTLLDDAFAAIARDAADKVEVHIALQEAFARLARSDDPAMTHAAHAASARALAFAEAGLLLDEDRDRVSKAAPSR